MNRATNWQIGSGGSATTTQAQSYVQAWASDSITGEPVYIFELGKQRRGAKCGCKCASCDLPLIAVNAAKSDYKKQPHFRHPNGAEKSDCMYLAARLAALQLLREQGVFELPSRRVFGKVLGLSDTQHVAWIDHPAERIKIRNFDFSNKAAALITLDDGRQVRFQLTGSSTLSEDGQIIASVYLDLKDLALAGMSTEDLRKRTTLIPDGLCWQSHWNDVELQGQANEAALAKAIDLMDIEGEYLDELKDIEPKFRRETLLHLEVKRILSEAQHIRVPEVQCYALRCAEDGHEIEKSVDFPSQMIPLMDVALEKRFGSLIPDVTARTPPEHGGVLLIEVTVTNTIHRERLERIQRNNVPALEINLSRTGGLISRSELRELAIECIDIKFKDWLCHPAADLCQQKLEAEANAELEARNDAIHEMENARRLVLSIPVEQVAKDYLAAIYSHETCRNRGVSNANADETSRLLQEVLSQAERLKIHGYGEAMDQELFGSRAKIIPRILAIKNGGGVGYELKSTMEVMNAIKQSQPQNRTFHTLYLIAEDVYRKKNTLGNPVWYGEWVKEIKESIKSSAQMYVRTRRYDRLLSLLFPEMQTRLKHPFGTGSYFPQTGKSPNSQTQQYSKRIAATVTTALPNHDENPESFYLTGRKLAEWKKTYPDAAKNYFDSEWKPLPAFEVLAKRAV